MGRPNRRRVALRLIFLNRLRSEMTLMRSLIRALPSLALAACLGLLPSRASSVDAPAPALAAACARADAALARADLAAYRGWIKFLRFEAENAAARAGNNADAIAAKVRRLDEWVNRIAAEPNLLATLRGVQEWAYESPVDGSGQPFKLMIPTDYDPARPAMLWIYMHGYSGNHLEHSTGMAARPGNFEVAVLGRARGSGYRAESEADVLAVVDYIQAHWSIDPARIHLSGGSMGGGGTYRLGSRYPQRWASGRPTCGYASSVPFGNLLTLPIYATHSDDDWVVPVIHERGPLARLRELGGQVIQDETTGLGHAAWEYREGNQRGDAWAQEQVRPDSRTVRHLDYTALDGGAMRDWWAEIAEWGPAPRPARFVLTAGGANTLFAQLTNITRLRLRLAESPFDPSQPLRVAVNRAAPIVLPPPLPATVVLAAGDKSWNFEARSEPAPFRLHTPGGANLLYDGEPLLIVYGTHGTDAERQAMRAAAAAAGRSSDCEWLDATDPVPGAVAPDGVPHSNNLYGWLNTKPDTEVTDADLARCHLVLIGTGAQNAVVARLADRLPVRFADGTIGCSDGVRFPSANNAFGLVHYNPLAPDRLVFWVASDNPATYAAASAIPLLMADARTNAVGVDLIVARATGQTLVATRSFDSRWRWTPGRETSPLVPEAIKTHRDFSAAVGAAIRRAADADFALVGLYGPVEAPAVVPGTTRVCDLAPLLFHYDPVGVFEATGAELTDLAHRIAAPKDPTSKPVYFEPQVTTGALEAGRTYRVAIPVDAISPFTTLALIAPRNYRLTDLQVSDALARHLGESR